MVALPAIKPKKQPIRKNTYERDTISSPNFFVDQTKKQTQGMMQEFWRQMLSSPEARPMSRQQGDMNEGEAILLSKQQQFEQWNEEARPQIRAAYDYAEEIRNIGKTKPQETREIETKLNDIIAELQRLAVVSVVLEKEVIEATGQTIVAPGAYHINFFEWLLIEIRQARTKVEDASSWLTTMQTKNGKKQKMNYWQMYKKHGTKFGLSGERSVSTQTA